MGIEASIQGMFTGEAEHPKVRLPPKFLLSQFSDINFPIFPFSD